MSVCPICPLNSQRLFSHSTAAFTKRLKSAYVPALTHTPFLQHQRQLSCKQSVRFIALHSRGLQSDSLSVSKSAVRLLSKASLHSVASRSNASHSVASSLPRHRNNNPATSARGNVESKQAEERGASKAGFSSPGQLPRESSQLNEALFKLNAAQTLHELTGVADSIKSIAFSEAWEIRQHPCHDTLITRLEASAKESNNTRALIDAYKVLLLYPASRSRSQALDSIAQQLTTALDDRLTGFDISEIIILLAKSKIKGVEYVNWIKRKLKRNTATSVATSAPATSAADTSSSSLLTKLPTEKVFHVVAALERLAPGAFREEIKTLRTSILQSILETKDFDAVIQRLNQLRKTGLLNTFTITQIRDRYLDVADSLLDRQKIALFGTCARLRLFNWKSVRPLLFPSWHVLDKMSSGALADTLAALTLIMFGNLQVIEMILNHKNLKTLELLNPGNCINVAYAICFYEIQDQKVLLNNALSSVFLSKGEVELNTAHLMRLHEINASLTFDFRATNARLPAHVIERASAAERDGVSRHSERTGLEQLRKSLLALPEEFALDCDVNVPVGPYNAQLVDQKKKAIIEIDYIEDDTTKLMRHRHFRLMGYRPTAINHWKWIAQGFNDGRGKFLVECLNEKPIRFAYPEKKGTGGNAAPRVKVMKR